jgi:acyl carrier protein
MIGERLMTSNEIKDVILDIIQDIDEDAELASIKADVPLRDQIDLDSMDFLDIVMELRKRYKLQIPEADYPELASLDSCVNYLEPRLKEA